MNALQLECRCPRMPCLEGPDVSGHPNALEKELTVGTHWVCHLEVAYYSQQRGERCDLWLPLAEHSSIRPRAHHFDQS